MFGTCSTAACGARCCRITGRRGWTCRRLMFPEHKAVYATIPVNLLTTEADWLMRWNSLDVPLADGVQCTLIPARDYRSPSGDWLQFMRNDDERRQLERDRQDFHRCFRPRWDLHTISGRCWLDEVLAYLSDHLYVAHWNLPTDSEEVERDLRKAVEAGSLVPVVNRNWRTNRRVFRPAPAPLRWPSLRGGGDPGQAVVPYGGLSTSVGVGPGAAAPGKAVSGIAGGGSDLDWLGAAATVAGAVLGGNVLDERKLASVGASSFAGGATLPDDAAAFEFGEASTHPGDVFEIAGLPFNGDPNSWLEAGAGMKKQWRMYGPNGAPLVDIDFDGHHGQPNPHAHNWDGTTRDRGWPVSILP